MPERKDLQKLSRKDQMEETMFLGLRLMEGVEEEAFSGNLDVPAGKSMEKYWTDWKIRDY